MPKVSAISTSVDELALNDSAALDARFVGDRVVRDWHALGPHQGILPLFKLLFAR